MLTRFGPCRTPFLLLAIFLCLICLSTTAANVTTVTAINPPRGTRLGGTSVTTTGTNLTGATAVTIGGTAATGVTVVDDTTITATTGAHAAGAVNVVVTAPGGTGTGSGLYQYVTPTALIASAPDLRALRADFILAAAPDKDGLEWVLATPKTKDSQLQNIAIGLRAGDLVALEILDSFGQKSSLRFSGFVANAPIDAASFQFKPPPGADVIRQ